MRKGESWGRLGRKRKCGFRPGSVEPYAGSVFMTLLQGFSTSNHTMATPHPDREKNIMKNKRFHAVTIPDTIFHMYNF